MWMIDGIIGTLEAISRLFMTVHDRCKDIPLLGDTIGDPFASVSHRIDSIILDVGSFNDWVSDISSRLGDLLSWDSIKSSILSSWSWLGDPVWWLWDEIWQKIKDYNAWLIDPVSWLWDEIWERIKGANPWLINPGSWLWSEIWERIKGHNSWLTDPAYYVSDWVRDRFDDWFWDFVEDQADKVIDIAGKILAKAW